MTDDEILAFALTMTKSFEPGPTSIAYVRGPMALISAYAQDRTDPIIPSTSQRDLAHPDTILLKFGGEFTALRAHRPPGAGPRTGTEAHFLLDEPTQTLMGWGGSRLELDLSKIGTPVKLK